MPKRLTLATQADDGFETHRKPTRRHIFLAEMGMADVYDRKGEFWKWMNFHLRSIKAEDGDWGIISNAGFIIDHQNRHATIFVQSPSSKLNTLGIDGNAINVPELEQAAVR